MLVHFLLGHSIQIATAKGILLTAQCVRWKQEQYVSRSMESSGIKQMRINLDDGQS